MVELNVKLSHEQYLELDGEDAVLLIGARFDALRAIGCDTHAAVVVAVHPEISIAEAFDLLVHGCNPRTVLRILL